MKSEIIGSIGGAQKFYLYKKKLFIDDIIIEAFSSDLEPILYKKNDDTLYIAIHKNFKTDNSEFTTKNINSKRIKVIQYDNNTPMSDYSAINNYMNNQNNLHKKQ